MKQVFEAYKIKNLEMKNRIVMAPMCMYSSDGTGNVLDFHRVHYGTRAVGGTALIIQEATAVTPNGRISSDDLGIWQDEHIEGLSDIVRLIHAGGALAGIQLAHAGRKCEAQGERTVAPSSIEFSPDYPIPHALTTNEIKELVAAFGQAARRARLAGYDTLEIHGAHGYLIHEFLSPLSNHRTDEYGGSPENFLRFLDEVVDAIRAEWPMDKALILRLSASDYLEGGLGIEETIRIVKHVKDRVDLIHLSSGGLVSAPIHVFPGYQVRFAEAVKRECDVPTIAVGLITDLSQAEEILGNDRADLIALGRILLRDPYWPIRQMAKTDRKSVPWQYERGF